MRINDGANSNTVRDNLIAYNGLASVFPSSPASTGEGVSIGNIDAESGANTGNSIQRNLIVFNRRDGVRIFNGASDNLVGGTDDDAGNIITYNGVNGVTIGADPVTGGSNPTDTSVDNGILGNSIFANAVLGIDLGNDGPTPNTPGGPHSGPNHLQNFPVLNSATSNSSGTTITGTLNSTPNTTFRVEFFSSPTDDQGRNFSSASSS